MPWPMRFGPPPRMMTFFLSEGAASLTTEPANGGETTEQAPEAPVEPERAA